MWMQILSDTDLMKIFKILHVSKVEKYIWFM